jgi:hypothetical protein
MRSFDLDEIICTAEPEAVDQVFRATISGNASLSSRAQLDGFLAAAHERVTRDSLRKIVVDIRELAFLNSSCLKSLVGWILRIKDMAPDRRYQVTFISNPQLNWQQRSLFAISSLAPDLVGIE